LNRELSDYEIAEFQKFNSTPVLSALLQLLAKGSPLTETQQSELRQASANKEFIVLDSTPRESVIDYSCFFGDYETPIDTDIPPNPAMASRVHKSIDDWIKVCRSRILYPRLSSKTVSHDTTLNAWEALKDLGLYQDEEVTQIDLEWIYHTFGIEVTGACEMRQRFYISELQPRTYFASGGDAFRYTKYAATLGNLLADSLPCSEKHACTNPTRLLIPSRGSAVIYDLTTFTSNLHEHWSFLDALSKYCKGSIVRTMDAVHGLVDRDLGDLVAQLRDLHRYAVYTTGRVFPVTTRSRHHVAGFLGVYGNITTAKFLHAAVVLQVHHTTDELNVVGDDGISGTTDPPRTVGAVQHLGTLEESKVYVTSEAGCIHLKRPVRQLGSRCIQSPVVNLPSLEYTLHKQNVDSRYGDLAKMTKNERRTGAGSNMLRCLQSLTRVPMTEEDQELVYSLLHWAYIDSGIPIEGHVPQVTGDFSYGFVPRLDRKELMLDPIENTIAHMYSGTAHLDFREHRAVTMSYDNGSQFSGNISPHLTYLCKLGYVNKTPTRVLYTGEVGYQLLIKEYVNPDPVVYTFTVIKDIPTQFCL